MSVDVEHASEESALDTLRLLHRDTQRINMAGKGKALARAESGAYACMMLHGSAAPQVSTLTERQEAPAEPNNTESPKSKDKKKAAEPNTDKPILSLTVGKRQMEKAAGRQSFFRDFSGILYELLKSERAEQALMITGLTVTDLIVQHLSTLCSHFRMSLRPGPESGCCLIKKSAALIEEGTVNTDKHWRARAADVFMKCEREAGFADPRKRLVKKKKRQKKKDKALQPAKEAAESEKR